MKPANAKSLVKSPGKRPTGSAVKRDTLVDSKNEMTHPTGVANSIFPVVGLGASAGGLEALEEFFRKKPANTADRRESAVAILLSGTGTDGTVGLSAIKDASGRVIVQSVESAKFNVF